MTRTRRGFASILAAAALTIGLGAVDPSHAQTDAATDAAIDISPAIRWRTCGPDLQCGRLNVPLDYDDPGTAVSIAMVRVPATNPARKIGTIFVNPGGPGGSGVDMVTQVGRQLFSAEVHARFDLVGFDPRGVGQSDALVCVLDFDTLPVLRNPFPLTVRQERNQINFDNAVSEQCTNNVDPLLNHMSTANVARDLDRMRAAVGDDRLTFVGYSYGTYIGATYASMFPDNVRAIVVDGVLDPVAWSTGRNGRGTTIPFSTRLRSSEGAYATLRAFFRQCDRHPRRCAFSGGSPGRRFDALLERLKDNPIPDGEGFEITYSVLVSDALSAMYNSFSWPSFAEYLNALDSANRSDVARHRAAFRRVLGLGGSQSLEAFPGVACSETLNPTDVGAWRRAGRADDEVAPYFGRLWTWATSICASWPGADDDRYSGPYTSNTRNTVLVMSSRYDPATPYAGAVTLASLLPNSRLLTVDSWGHTAYGTSRCGDSAVYRYLITRIVPPEGTVCAPNFGPFDAGFDDRNAEIRASIATPITPLG